MRFLREEAGFAQLITVNHAGFPVGRTIGAPINDDWSVDLVQRRSHRRLEQLRANPRLELVWVGAPAAAARNDHPPVFDFGQLIPRAVFLRGIAELLDGERTVECYQHLTARQRGKGFLKAPRRSPDNARAELAGIHVHPVRVRVEGFGDGPQSYTWNCRETA